MRKITILGCGLVGAAIARDLSREEDLEVTVADASRDALGTVGAGAPIRRLRADLSYPETIERVVAEADAVVGALPGRLGFRMLETVIAAGKPVADISFSPEDPLSLDGLAREKGVTAVVDCGVSPGISNFAVGRAAAELSSVGDVLIRVGGLPVDRHRPFEYAVVFSAADVLEEYTRPARIVEDGALVTKPSLSEVEAVEVPGVGTLEAFLTDGLRTLLTTVPARSMREKTLRYPGHAESMRALRECGFLDTKKIEAEGVEISPRAVTQELLGRAWKLGDGEAEFTYLSVDVAGSDSSGSRRDYRFELLDRTHPKERLTSMARTTGFPCSILAAMLARGEYRDPGIRPPEMLPRDPSVSDRFLRALRSKGLAWTEDWKDPAPRSGL